MLLNVKRPVPTHKGKHPRVSNLWEGGGEWRDWPRFQIGQNPALQSKEKGIQGGPFKTLPPPRCLPRLRISPTLQAKSFIPVKCRFCWDDRPASVTPLLPVVWQEGLCGKVSVSRRRFQLGSEGPPGPPSQVSQLGSGQNLQTPPSPRQVWPKIQDALTSCLGQPPPFWRLLSAPTFSLFISG